MSTTWNSPFFWGGGKGSVRISLQVVWLRAVNADCLWEPWIGSSPEWCSLGDRALGSNLLARLAWYEPLGDGSHHGLGGLP